MKLFAIFIQASGGGLGGLLGGLFPFLLMIVALYFLIIMPQRKRQRELQNLIENLKVGDRVITSSGIIATIASLKDQTLIVRSAEKTMLEISKASVAGLQAEEEKK
jgi:preprotein translocase subunit YajC